MSNIIVPERFETRSVKRGRDVVRAIYAQVEEAADKGQHPLRVLISQGSAECLHAFLDYAYDQYDGTFPLFCGLPIDVEPGDSIGVRLEVTHQ